jgi:hypothetical protein
MHFGLFLHRRGIITAEQLVAALEVQLKHLVPIGQLALEECVLTARQIFDVLRAQDRSPHVLFGELAIELGFMTRDDLMRLLMIQADRRIPLEKILIWQGVLTRETAALELNLFRKARHNPRRATQTKVLRGPHARTPELAGADAVLAI